MKFDSITSLAPTVSTTLAGSAVGVSRFELYTDRDFPCACAAVRLPDAVKTDYVDAKIAVKLGYRNVLTWTALTGWVGHSFFDGRETRLVLRDCPKKYETASLSLSYRKETAARILGDILDAGGVDTRKLTVPSVTLDRFAVEKVAPRDAVRLLVGAMSSYADMSKVRFFFDALGAFRFGTPDDTGANPGESVEFTRAGGIISIGDDYIEALPVPIRHSQTFTLKGDKKTAFRTRLSVTADRSRQEIWYA